MNGLLGWALREIGFDVVRVMGGVHRRERGDGALGNHVVLLVGWRKPISPISDWATEFASRCRW